MSRIQGSIKTCRHQTAIYLMDYSSNIEIFYPSSRAYSTSNIKVPFSAFNLVVYKDKLCFLSYESFGIWDSEWKWMTTFKLTRRLKRTDLVVMDENWCYLLEHNKLMEGWRLDLESAELIRLS